MARKKANRRAENLSDFAGPDADRENIEKLAAAAKKANGKAGHNSEPPDEVIKRNADAIEVALNEVDAALRIVQAARANLGVARKTAKTDLGSKTWVESIVAAVKLKREAEKGGSGEIVTEHRQMGRVLRLMNCPLGTQFNLFAVPEIDTDGAKVDATAQGEQAGREGADRDSNPYTPGTTDWFAYNNGWQVGQDAIAAGLGRGNGEAPAH